MGHTVLHVCDGNNDMWLLNNKYLRTPSDILPLIGLDELSLNCVSQGNKNTKITKALRNVTYLTYKQMRWRNIVKWQVVNNVAR